MATPSSTQTPGAGYQLLQPIRSDQLIEDKDVRDKGQIQTFSAIASHQQDAARIDQLKLLQSFPRVLRKEFSHKSRVAPPIPPNQLVTDKIENSPVLGKNNDFVVNLL